MLTIHGVTRSRASRIVWLCHEIGLPFQQVPVIQAYRLPDPAAEDAPLNTQSPQFRALSPAGAIPVIEDGDLILSESMACTLYLAQKYGDALAARDAAEQALMLQWSFYATSSIEADALTILYLHRKGREQPAEDQAAVAHAAERLVRPLAVLEQHFSQNRFMIADRFTVADINMAEVLRYAQGFHPLFEQFPSVRGWLSACQSRPAFEKMWQERLAEPE